ncbi:RICIN domain-containing protein [Streptomyces jumonjinensis]|uniref:Ricin B lectin domain-containing protein n=1 Tax=Streptomyces jumonjinensis TaxID=1945 RepID=A0A646KR36_STRJU|nr:RICIN domain-containing protein [Streptomyces jumonjinensis]MQT04497.1 hypothetical protein [Streptomyces jumonjinensis]
MPLTRIRRRGGAVAALTALVSLAVPLVPQLTPDASAAAGEVRAGEINIIARHSGRCVEAESSSVVSGAAVVQEDCTGQAGAAWRLQDSPAGGGTVNLVNANSGWCLEAPSSAVGTPARQGVCGGAPSVSFRIVDRTTHVWLQPLSASPARCLEVAAGSHAPGAAVRLAECSGQSGTAFHQRVPGAGNDPAAEPGGVVRANVTSTGAQTAGFWRYVDVSSVSATGRYLVFESGADIAVRDLAAGTTEPLGLTAAPARRSRSYYGGGPGITQDGRYVVFLSDAALVAADTNAGQDVYLRDRHTGANELISRSATGQPGNGMSEWPSISPNGRHVVFLSNADNLVPGDTNASTDVFLRDRQTGTVERVNLTAAGGQGDSSAWAPRVSADGWHVSFTSGATDLVAGDTNRSSDVFVRDRQTGTTERVSVSSGGGQGDKTSYDSSISADGRYVAFESSAANLVAGDTNNALDVFVRDRQSGATERVSLSSGGGQGLLSSYAPSISGDGRYVAFSSDAETLVPYDTNAVEDVFVRDRQAGTTVRASVNGSGVQGDKLSNQPEISVSGQYVVFQSEAANLVPGDTNNAQDLFVLPRPAA